ncbi:unnamed protein product [Arabidopsis lyrata]|uniref:Uncharacterized protein n=2 Tax=Arabidopsis lyrata subsp. lyrata TaxID=81972 RepID=D7MTK5_ARALL|nr:hypothetical protein ARALYDRAFT_916919 [Arabidopsis lyrata subsp. lyrata]EFH42256.1 hypothetical protein ARALYDRAFT_918483 [Arabidopsis lyrata subsp. lyrata]CAH8278196.1 unnamed protein product [Arabidopsis lyrata]CAH8279565.1 unnamed protein product [Arabidopsis lyrata]
MHSSNLLLEEPIMMASILKPFKSIVGTLGPKYRSVEALSGCLKTGMSVAPVDFSWGDADYITRRQWIISRFL